MVVSVLASAVDDLSVDIDDGAPSAGQLIVLGLAGEVGLAGLSEVAQPLAGAAGVLEDGEVDVGLDISDCCVSAIVELVQVGVELRAEHVHLALHRVVDGRQLAVEPGLTGLHGEVGGADDLARFDDLLHLEDERSVEGLGDGDHLGVPLVGVRVEIEHLPAVPSSVVDASETDLGSNCSPSEDAAVEVVQSIADVGGGEVAVDDQVGAVVHGEQSDIIDGEAVRVAEGGSVELQDVLS